MGENCDSVQVFNNMCVTAFSSEIFLRILDYAMVLCTVCTLHQALSGAKLKVHTPTLLALAVEEGALSVAYWVWLTERKDSLGPILGALA